MSLSKPLAARRLVPALFPLAHADAASAAASRRARRRGAFVSTPPAPPPSPSSVRLAEPLPSLAPSRLALHNSVLALLSPTPAAQAPDLDEAALLTRHALHSNCRPSSFTCIAVLAALLRARRLDDFFALHRFALQAAVPPTAATHALYLSALAARRLPDAALLHLRLIARPGSPVPPSPTAYRVVVKCLVADHGRLADAVELKDEMLASGFVGPDPHVYSLLMAGFVEARDGAKAVELYQELQDKLGGEPVLDGIVYGSLMKAYFLMGMEEKAMECYKEVFSPDSEVRFGTESYNEVVDALGQNQRLEDALNLFDRMLREHDPPLRITVDVRSFSVMVDAYCAAGRFEDAIAVFRRMGEYKVVPDVAAYNNLIRHLGLNRLVDEAEVLHKEMCEQILVADEETCVLLMEACFKADRIDDGISYFDKMAELELKPDASAYHRIVDGLVGLSLLDKAQEYFDQMREKGIHPSIATYETLLKAYVDVGAARLDDAAKVAKCILLDENVVFSDEMRELLEGALRGEGREDDIAKLYEDVEREKAEAVLRAEEEKARAEALAREERAARRAEAAAKDEAAAKASAAAIEAIIGHRRKTEGETAEPASTPNALGGGFLSRLGLSSPGEGAPQDTPIISTETKDGQEQF
ncbi:pentatricopeptide repeat-containing protein At3g49240, mitochondrial-like [Hordeum vulgare subsp. vulgare]|uniref:Pentacotripeptide-repeat region of PRORP domain-containing protein n=1 Tax=Hordeum vulgare subsp. vulgare TaxID=112509 RepID=A0A8I6X6E8_HORVV|nr:pentatricopeptide repeat-containing protein At3g49240, mitochondrial-like [Hordeum vulgare subsp. vulgare]